MGTLVILICILGYCRVMCVMVMDKLSCVEVEQEQCGICHTIYIKECQMKMVEEMMPAKVTKCKNVARYQEKCHTEVQQKMVEEERPVCKVEMMNDNHAKCDHKKPNKGCKKVLVCHLG